MNINLARIQIMKLGRTLERSGHLITLTQMQTSSPTRTTWTVPPEVGPVPKQPPNQLLDKGGLGQLRALHYYHLLFLLSCPLEGYQVGQRPNKQRPSLLLDKGNFSPLLSSFAHRKFFSSLAYLKPLFLILFCSTANI